MTLERAGHNKGRTEAETIAAGFQAELRVGRYREPLKGTWGKFRERDPSEKPASLADGTDGVKVASLLRSCILSPTRVERCRLLWSEASFQPISLARAEKQLPNFRQL